MDILVFCTNVKYKKQIKILEKELNAVSGISHWCFDLEDCDKILRIKGFAVSPQKIINLLNSKNFICYELN